MYTSSLEMAILKTERIIVQAPAIYFLEHAPGPLS